MHGAGTAGADSRSWITDSVYGGYVGGGISISVGRDGTVHVLCRMDSSVGSRCSLVWAEGHGDGWKRELFESVGVLGGIYGLGLAADTVGRPHAFYTRTEESGDSRAVYGWNDGTAWCLETVASPGEAMADALVLDGEDSPHVLYRVEGAGGEEHWYAHKVGERWVSEPVAPGHEEFVVRAIAVDSQEGIHFGLMGENAVAWAAKLGGEWRFEVVEDLGDRSSAVAVTLAIETTKTRYTFCTLFTKREAATWCVTPDVWMAFGHGRTWQRIRGMLISRSLHRSTGGSMRSTETTRSFGVVPGIRVGNGLGS